jgi:cytochrome P450
MKRLSQSPIEPDFVQNPYTFYNSAVDAGDLFYWNDYDLVCARSHRAVSALLRDRRFGREQPAEFKQPHPPHLLDFYAIDDNSMLELEPPIHTRLRGLVLRAFTKGSIQGMSGKIEQTCDVLLSQMSGKEDLLSSYAQMVPILVIADFLDVPSQMAPQMLKWSHDMVAIYQARKTHEIEVAANTAAKEFTSYLRDLIAEKRKNPADDLLSSLINARDDKDALSDDELIATTVLLLNAGHEATVHSLGNGISILAPRPDRHDLVSDKNIANTVEEILRLDPPLHMFTRYATETVEVFGHQFERGDQVALLLGAANRDPEAYQIPESFHLGQSGPIHTSFGAGLHFCVGAPLARLEMTIALQKLFSAFPNLSITQKPQFADLYHFHGLENLKVDLG